MLPHRSPRDRLVERVAGLCARAQDPLELFERVAELVREQVPYDVAGWILIDPDTMLMTGVYGEGVEPAQHRELIACELGLEDVNKFWELARDGVPAAALSASTDGDLARSARWSRVYGPHGYGDEIRAVFATGRVAWGHGCLTRRASEPFFTDDEVELIAAIAPHLGNGIRGCYLLDGMTGADPRPGDAGTVAPPAMVVLDDEGAVVSLSEQAREWLGPPDEVDVSFVLHEVAHQARLLADGEPSGSALDEPALARARSRDGEWLVVRGIRLTSPDPPGTGPDAAQAGAGTPGTTALVLEPARRADLAPLLMGLHQLTDREREVTQLLLVGMSIAQIAQELWITPETLRGHVKSIFAKLGVSSRPELAAMLSHEPRYRARPDAPAAPRSR